MLEPNQIKIADYEKRRPEYKTIFTKMEFFKDDFTVLRYPEKLVFKRTTIDTSSKIKIPKAKLIKKTGLLTFGKVLDFPSGLYVADEYETNEDQVVIYKNQ